VSIDLTVWPETAVGTPVKQDEVSSLARNYLLRDRTLDSRNKSIASPLAVGMMIAEEGNLFNSVLLVERERGLLGRYDKQVLVPIGESRRIGGFEWPRLPVGTPFATGAPSNGLVLNGRVISASICYEDVFPEVFRHSVRRIRPELLINLTSDTWFRGSSAAEFHFALAKLRAVEHRKYLARATRDGVSALVDPAGRVLMRRSDPGTHVDHVRARWLASTTPYSEHGDLWLLCGLVALTVATTLLQKLTRRASDRLC
jgi:apolipoprotein N-acyltransferase